MKKIVYDKLEKNFSDLAKKYEKNELFDNLLDLSLNIDAIFTLLITGNHVIISKEEYEQLKEQKK